MRTRHLLVVLLLTTLPLGAHASVRISEIAWMGSASNANAEWIELHNDGTVAVPLSGWKITSSTGAPIISLTGTVAAGGYYLLTRTSTSIIPGVTGDQIYSGALSNSGATLTLTDGGGGTIDTVVGGTNWTNIGGDNTTKQTPQLTDSATWVTADPTPRAATVATDAGSGNATTSSNSGTNASSTPPVSIGGTALTLTTVVPPVPQLFIYVGNDRTVSTHTDELYRAIPYGGDGQALTAVPITWSFGDGTEDTGALVRHAYHHPGTYLIVVRAENGRASAIKTLKVAVQDARVSITAKPEGIFITNGGEDIVDLSEWKLEAGGSTFKIPKDTAMLPRSTVLLASEVTRLPPFTASTTLRYPSGAAAASTEYQAAEVEKPASALQEASVPKEPRVGVVSVSTKKSPPPNSPLVAAAAAAPIASGPSTVSKFTNQLAVFFRNLLHVLP